MKKLHTTIIDRLATARNILLITHINPDGDALGSLCFMSEWMAALGKTYTAYCAGPVPESLAFLPGYFSIITDTSKLSWKDFDLILSLDCGSVARTNVATEIAARSKDQVFMEIDHHPSVEKVSDVALRNPGAASTTEILYELSLTAGLALTPIMAKCLLTGLLTDTGNFTFLATSDKTMAAASALLLRGANLFKIIDRTSRTKTLPDLKLWGKALARLQLNARFNLAYTVLTEEDFKEYAAAESAAEGLAEFISSLPEVTAIMVLRDDGRGMIRGNLRTIKSTIDVGALARQLGGGGHRMASGFAVPGRLHKTESGWQVETYIKKD